LLRIAVRKLGRGSSFISIDNSEEWIWVFCSRVNFRHSVGSKVEIEFRQRYSKDAWRDLKTIE
jgi:hypothetical protein